MTKEYIEHSDGSRSIVAEKEVQVELVKEKVDRERREKIGIIIATGIAIIAAIISMILIWTIKDERVIATTNQFFIILAGLVVILSYFKFRRWRKKEVRP